MSFARRVAGRLKSIYRAVRPKRSVAIGGRSYALPTSRGSSLNFSAEHEPWLDWVYEAALQTKEGTFVDVGVNRGQTLAKMLRIAPESRYVGIEPQSGCVFHIEEFFRINGLESCTIIATAFSDHSGFARLKLNSPAVGDSTASIAQAHRPDSFYVRSSVIPVFPGDALFSKLPEQAIALIKIDVEGAELEVLRGLSATLRKKRPFVVFEVLNNYLVVTRQELSVELTAYRNERARQISSFFDDAGYAVFNIRGKSLIQTEIIKPEVSSDLSITNYLAVPNELLSEIESRFDVRHAA
jgi:FkbM family methyltransferase